LLGIVFRAEASEDDRNAAAREVGGTLAAGSQTRSEYIRLPEGVQVKVAASKLIKVSAVSAVSEVSCPG
jgi:hypothetical protein